MSTKIQCPKCAHAFSVEEAIAEKVEKGYAQELKEKERQLQSNYRLELEKLSLREEKLAQAEAQEEERLKALLEAKEKALALKLQAQMNEQFAAKLQSLEEENELKTAQLKDLRKQELALQRREQALREAQEEQEIKLEERILKERQRLQDEMDERLSQRVELKLREKELLIKQLNENIEDMKRKSEQGSMQVQGEAQEVAIEELLKERFPLDHIGEVGKGQRGADCLQVVRNRSGQDCGAIIYESKRTKAFSKLWLNKLKQDALDAKANIPVLVSEAMPEGQKGIIQMDGVWVCDFASVGTLAMILRFALIKEFQAMGTQENKGEKMQMLYDYLTGNEFKMQVQTMVDGFEVLQAEIKRQRRAMETSWKKQEKALEMVFKNTIGFHSSVRGIAGAAVAAIPLLEFDEED